jgi:nicotinamidase-related amidase
MADKALVVIDVQNDYFPGGKFPLWNTEAAAAKCVQLIGWAKSRNIPVVLVQHVADDGSGTAPFFNGGSIGVQIHDSIRTAAPNAPVIEKQHADSFEQTNLEATLAGLGVDKLILCGMMTHNCVTHTAISKAAEKYDVTVVSDACATVSEILHLLALHALSIRVKLIESAQLS